MNRRKDWKAIWVRVRGLVEPARSYTTAEAAAVCGVGEGTIQAPCVTGELPSRLGPEKNARGRLLRTVRGRDLVAFLRERAFFSPRPKAA